jgi:hypothetical protein
LVSFSTFVSQASDRGFTLAAFVAWVAWPLEDGSVAADAETAAAGRARATQTRATQTREASVGERMGKYPARSA